MDYRRFGNTVIVRLDPGEEILDQLDALAQKEQLRLASISGLGALKEMEISVFHPAEKVFYNNCVIEALELTSLTGTITEMNGNPYLHIHASAGNAKGAVVGGHLKKAVVSVTAEIVITVIDGTVEREHDEETGLNRFRF